MHGDGFIYDDEIILQVTLTYLPILILQSVVYPNKHFP